MAGELFPLKIRTVFDKRKILQEIKRGWYVYRRCLENKSEWQGSADIVQKVCFVCGVWIRKGKVRRNIRRKRAYKKRKLIGFLSDNWSGRLDLNQRPSAPEADALPSCATSRNFYLQLPLPFGGAGNIFTVTAVHFYALPKSCMHTIIKYFWKSSFFSGVLAKSFLWFFWGVFFEPMLSVSGRKNSCAG